MKNFAPAYPGEAAVVGGGFPRPAVNRMPNLICYCLRVDKQAIISAIEAGCSSVEDLSARLRVCTGCGGCRNELEGLLGFYGDETANPKNPPAP